MESFEMVNESTSNGVAEAPVATTDVANSSANITSELVTYRKYGQVVQEDDGKGGTVTKVTGADGKGSASNLSEGKDQKGWKEQDAKGATLLTENAVRFYSVENEEGFTDLVPSPEQRTWIINKGLASLQNTAAVSALNEWDEKTNSFVHNGDTIDLRADINEPPKRVSLNPLQKLQKDVMALDPAEAFKAIQALMLQLAAQQVQG